MDRVATLSLRARQRFPSGFVTAPDLDVELTPGSLVVLFGPSGAGKTTMLRQIAGLERPDEGRLSFDGETWCDVARRVWVPPQRRRVGLVFQEPTLFPHLSVADNIAFGADARASRVAELASLVGVEPLLARRPRALSGGEGQRVALARALAINPRLLLLDEPFASLDAPTRVRLRRDVRALLQRMQTPALLVTHDRAEAMAIGDELVVVMDGRVRQAGPIAAVFSRPADAEVAAALGIEAVLPARIVGSADGLLSVAVGGVTIQAAEREPMTVGAEVFACVRAEDVTIETGSPAHASARNHLVARIVAIAPDGPVDRVTLDCGFALDAIITRRSREDLQLAPGVQVTAGIKATSVHVVAR
jgi:molybdate transport system ATP-binding protein